MGVFDFIKPNRKPSANNDLEAVLTPAKSENFLSSWLPDDPDKRSQVARALIMGGASAMAAGGPSVGKPTNLLTVLGQGLAGGIKGYDDALTTDNEAAKTRVANAAQNIKLQTVKDSQDRAKAFFAKYGNSPGVNGYSPEALSELMQLQLLNGDEEGARATQSQIQKLQQHGADNGMVVGPDGSFQLAPGYGASLFETQKDKSLGDAVGKNAEKTSDIKGYEYGLNNPGFVQQQIDLKKAGVQAPDDKFSGKASELAAERYAGLANQGADAANLAGNIKTLTDLGKTIGTGKWAEVKKSWGPTFQSFGIPIDNLSDIQAFDSLVARLAPSMRPAGSGSSSDTDVAMFLRGLPSLGNTTEGNDLIGATMGAVQQNKIAASKVANDVLSGKISWQEGDRQIAALPDPFEAYKAFKGGKTDKTATSSTGDKSSSGAAPKTSRMPSVPVISSEDAFTKLPKGATFRFDDDPEGTMRTKS